MSRSVPQFRGFVGHEKEVNLALRQLEGARALGEPYPSTKLTGPSGVGKTRLAQSLATEYGTYLKVINGRATAAELSKILRGLKACDFLFVDEAHNLVREAQELLYPVIDDQRVPLFERDGRPCTGQTHVEIPPITIMLATDQPGKLLNALSKRMAFEIRLGFYNLREMRAIVDRLATDMDLLISPQAAKELAQISLGLPRKAKHHLQNLRRYFPDAERRQLSVGEIREFRRAFGIDSRGLGDVERAYVRFLGRNMRASVESLASHLGYDVDYVRRQIEPVLRRAGLMTIGSQGRQLTDKGRELLRQKLKRPSRTQ